MPELTIPKPAPSIKWSYTLAVIASINVPVSVYTAIDRFYHPRPTWMIHDRQWYDLVIQAIVWLIILGACITYTRYRHALNTAGLPAIARPWSKRTESRIVLYTIVSSIFAHIPIDLIESIIAFNNPSNPFPNDYQLMLPMDLIFSIPVAIALIYFDRTRMTRDKRIAENLCLTCGYDLRSSPERCPECGTYIISSNGKPDVV